MPVKPRMAFDTAILVAGLACAALLAVKSMTSRISLIGSLLLVPFFFCFVTAITGTFGDGLYYWDKWKGRFVPLDAEERPVMAKFLHLFCIVASALFVVFYFKLPA